MDVGCCEICEEEGPREEYGGYQLCEDCQSEFPDEADVTAAAVAQLRYEFGLGSG